MTDIPDEQTPVRRSLRDRTLGLRGVAAVALASVVLGGAGGVALGAVTDGADDSRPGQLGGPGPGRGGQVQLPPGQPGAANS